MRHFHIYAHEINCQCCSLCRGDYTYFNDVHVFDLDTYTWSNVAVEGTAPSPRSGTWEQLSVREKISTFQHNPITSFLSYKLIKLFPYNCGLFLGCCMTLTQDEKSVIVYSGYSKKALKKDVDKGTIHEDLFTLSKSTTTCSYFLCRK